MTRRAAAVQAAPARRGQIDIYSYIFYFEEEIIMVKIRLARIGEKKVPIYRIVVQEASCPRNGKTIDSIGYYDPNTEPAIIRIDAEKANEWIGKGAQPTDVVKKLMKNAAKAN